MTTTAAVRSDDAQAYLDGVAAELADLPADDRADLLDELATHLDELAAESDAPLESRLGPPADYAAELRTSAGLPPAATRGRTAGRLRGRLGALRGRREVTAARSFLASLRPAWWVLRAWVLVGIVAMWPGQSTSTWSGGLPFVPRIVTPEVGLLVLLGAIWASVQLGRGVSALPRRAVLALNVAAAVLALPVLGSCIDQANDVVYIQQGAVYPADDAGVPSEGVYAAGSQVWNLYAYDAQGTLLHDVRLYDQEGHPLTLGLAPDGTRRPVIDTRGRLVQNAFPYRYVEADGTVANPDAGPTVDAPPLVVTAPTASSPTPSPTPSGSARAGKR